MDPRTPHSFESAAGDLIHLIKEGFLPLCVTDGRGGVAILLVDSRESFLVLTKEAHQLVNAGASIEDVYRRAAVDKLWYDLGDLTAADRLVRRIATLLEQTA